MNTIPIPTPAPSGEAPGIANYFLSVSPYLILQALSIIFLGVIAITTDGQTRSEIVSSLLIIGAGNIVASGATSVAHIITSGSVQKAQVTTTPAVITANALPPTEATK